jgi:CHASE2 domain-containing sensor protein
VQPILRNRPALAALLLGLCALLALAGAGRPLFLEKLERQSFDWRMARLSPLPDEQKIIIVRAWEESFRRLGEWPWPRTLHARLLERLSLARLTAVDILFPERSTPEADHALARAVREAGNVVLAMHVAPDKNRAQGVLLPPYPELADAALGLGTANVEEDLDGLIRAHAPLRMVGDAPLPSLPLAVASRLLGAPAGVSQEGDGLALRLGSRTLPLTDEGFLWLDFSTPPFPAYEYESVLEGHVPPETFRDAVVVVGIAASGAEDFHVVPDGLGKRVIPGTDYNALALRTLLAGQVPRRISPPWSAALIFGLCLAGLLAALPPKPVVNIALLAGLMAAFSAANLLLFTRALLWLDFVPTMAALFTAFLAASWVRHLRLHHDWRVKSYSLASLYDLERSGHAGEALGDHLAAIWPPLEAATGVHLLEAQTDLRHARRDVRRAVEDDLAASGGTARVVVFPSEEAKAPMKMALPVPPAAEDSALHYTVLGWRGTLREDTLRTLAATVLSATWFFQAEERERERRRLLTETIHSIFRALDFRDPITGGHSDRVATLTREILAELDLPEQEKEDIHLGALIHDIGKIGIPDAVLGKPEKLSGEEFGLILKHPAIGEDILVPVCLPETARRAVAEHHERCDGSGYPKGLTKKELSLGGRVVAVADVFDALRSDRPYRKGSSLRDVCDYISERAGGEFDARVVDILLRLKAPEGWKPPHGNDAHQGD